MPLINLLFPGLPNLPDTAFSDEKTGEQSGLSLVMMAGLVLLLGGFVYTATKKRPR